MGKCFGAEMRIAVGLLVTLSIGHAVPSLASSLGPEDLPGVGETRTVSGTVDLIIPAGQTGTLAGKLEITAGSVLNIINQGTFVAEGGTFDCSSGTLHVQNLSDFQAPNLNWTSYASTVTFQNDGTASWGNMNLTNTGLGTFSINNASTGTVEAANWNINTDGAYTNVNNAGNWSVNNLNMLDQNDNSCILNTATLNINNINVTANGAEGYVCVDNSGTITSNLVNINTNYGGTFNYDGSFGSLEAVTFNGQANGESHGKTSCINILNGYMQFEAQNFNINGAQLNVQNNGYDAIDTLNVNVTGEGVANFQNNGAIIYDNVNLNAYDGRINLANNGWMTADEITILAQSASESGASVKVVNSGSVYVWQSVEGTGNGYGELGFQNNGTMDLGLLELHGNYGGKASFNSLFGGTQLDDMILDASGTLDGQAQIVMLAYGNIQASGVVTIGGSVVDTAFLLDDDPAYFLYDPQAGTYLVAFNPDGTTPGAIPEPLTIVGLAAASGAIAMKLRRCRLSAKVERPTST